MYDIKEAVSRNPGLNQLGVGAQRDMGMQADGESDELKRVLLEGNPIFLAITFAVSMLHSVFDVLAFKNDIGFWRNKKSVEGLSVRTVGINCFCQACPLCSSVTYHYLPVLLHSPLPWQTLHCGGVAYCPACMPAIAELGFNARPGWNEACRK